jgi:nucleotide-binding universal stress UspA family protein
MVDLNGGELHLLHAWELYGESAMRSSAFVRVSSSELAERVETERQAARDALDELLELTEMADRPWKVHLLKGPAAQVVPHVVAKRRVNLLVMGTVARVGVSAAVMGNTAERVLDEVSCSVIAVKPEGFVSPIRARTG